MHLIRLAAATLVVCLVPHAASAEWVRLRTEHFEFVGDAPARDIRRVARSLEQFREVMASIIPSSADAKEPPRVVVFRSRQAMTPYLPQFEGRPVESAGVFIQSSDASYIIMDGASSGPGDPIVFHEYTHFLVRRALPDVPVWVSEGLAEFYAMFQERDGGRAALIGAPAPQHLEVLRRQTLIPLHELAAVDHSSPMYNEGARRGVFYAQSWALVHYLLMGKTRTQQFNTYLTAIQGGTPAQEAFAATFGSEMPALERELRDYIAAFLFPVVTFKFADRIRGRADDDPTALADHEAQSYLADLVGALGRTEEARARFKEILAGNPDAPLALRGSGLLELQFGRANDAMPLLERAAELRPDDGRVLEALGRGLYGRAEEAMDRQERERLTDRARETLARADTLGASSPSMLAALGYLESVGSTPESLERATAYLERAVRLEPTNEELRLRLASVLVYRKELDAATTILGRLLATGRGPDVKERARGLLADVSALRRAASGEFGPAADGSGGARPAASAAASGGAASTARRGSPRARPILRPTVAGELQVRGRFRAIECAPGRVTLLIETNDGGVAQLRANALTDIDFVTYRTDTPGAVQCGLIDRLPVVATYRLIEPPVGSVLGEAIAIELVDEE